MATIKRKRTLQEQGVPVPSKLNGPQARGTSGQRFRESQGAPAPKAHDQAAIARRNSAPTRRTTTEHSATISPPSFGQSGGNSSTSVGALEVEFLAAIFLLVLILFANKDTDYTTRMMSFIKRGSLTCLLFFLLALVSGSGPRANRVAVAFGALIIVGILVTAPVGQVVSDVDMLIKNDWVGSVDNFEPASANAGTQSSTHDPLTQAQPNPFDTKGVPGSGIVHDILAGSKVIENVGAYPYRNAVNVLGDVKKWLFG